MRILLVKPISDIHIVSPPLSLAYLAATIKDKTEVRILDCLLRKYDYQDFKKYLSNYEPDILGFTSFTLEFHSVLKMSKIAKSLNPDIKIIVGGPHVSNHPKDLEKQEIDFIFRGEAEQSFPKLIDELKKEKPNFKKIPGLGYKDKGKRRFVKESRVQDIYG